MCEISKIARISRSTRKPYTGSGLSVSTWGHQASAVSETEMRSLKGDSLACSGIKPAGRCRTWALAIAYGAQGIPRARIVRETMRAYFVIIRSVSSKKLADIGVAWSKAENSLIDKHLNVSAVHGFLSDVIYISFHVKWDPMLYNLWKDDTGNILQIVDWAVSPDIVIAEIAKPFFKQSLVKAAVHHNGKGIENGVDVTNTLRHVRNIETTSDVNYKYKAAIETIISGTTWSANRINSISPDYNNLCTRCGLGVETNLHTFY